jgi:hypothetical protein
MFALRSRFSFFEFVCLSPRNIMTFFFWVHVCPSLGSPWCFVSKFLSLSPLHAIAYVLCAFPRRQLRCHHLCSVRLSEKTTLMPSPMFCAPFWEDNIYHRLCFVHLYFVYLFKQIMSMPPSPTFPHWSFVCVYASSFTNACLWMPKKPSPDNDDVPLLTFPRWQSPSPTLLHRKLTILQPSSLAKLPFYQTKCLCALSATDTIAKTSSSRPSLLT